MNSIAAWRERRRGRVEERRRQAEPPLGPKAELPGGLRTWMQISMQWMVDQFGTEPLRRQVVLPSAFVPADYDGSESAARALCHKVSEWMHMRTSSPLRAEEITRLRSTPVRLVATVAHELSHDALTGPGLIAGDRPDAEAMAELFAVYQGFGVILLNQAVEPVRGRPWIVERLGSLGERGYAEALATYWLRRRELCPGQPVMPSWRKEVDWSARLLFSRRLQLLSERGEA